MRLRSRVDRRIGDVTQGTAGVVSTLAASDAGALGELLVVVAEVRLDVHRDAGLLRIERRIGNRLD